MVFEDLYYLITVTFVENSMCTDNPETSSLQLIHVQFSM